MRSPHELRYQSSEITASIGTLYFCLSYLHSCTITFTSEHPISIFLHSPRPQPSLHSWNSNIYIFHPKQPRPSLITSSLIPFIYVYYDTHRKFIWPFHMYTIWYTLDLGLVSRCELVSWVFWSLCVLKIEVMCASGVCKWWVLPGIEVSVVCNGILWLFIRGVDQNR